MDEKGVVFEPVQISSVAEAVVEQIENLIVHGVLKSGQRLPPERTLAEQMSASRPMVREAIKTLEDRGLLVSKHGEGTFVAELTGTALSPAMINLFAQHSEGFGGYLELRKLVEGYAAATAARRATEEDREIIRLIVEEMKLAHAAYEPEREVDLDVAFHIAVLDAAQNPMLTHVMASIYELLRRGVFLGRDMQIGRGGARDALLAQHQEIARHILAADPEAAAAAATRHIEFIEKSLDQLITDKLRKKISQKRRSLFKMAHPDRSSTRFRA